MITGNLTDLKYNIKWSHTQAQTIEEYWPRFFTKIITGVTSLQNTLTSISYSKIEMSINEHLPYLLYDNLFKNGECADESFSNILSLSMEIAHKETQLENVISTKRITPNIQEIKDNDVLILVRPALYNDIWNETFKHMKTNITHILHILKPLSKRIQFMYKDRQYDIQALQNYTTHSTIEAYIRNKSKTFNTLENIRIYWNMASYYPIRVYIDSRAHISEIAGVLELIDDVIHETKIANIVEKRFKVQI